MSSAKGKFPHPTVKAFFDALDQNQNRKEPGSNAKPKALFVQKKTSELGWRNRHSQSDRYPLVVAGQHFSVKQVQRGEVEETFGTGATVWPAALVLIKYMERHAEQIFHKRRRSPCVLDLGAGTGVTSIAAALLMKQGGKVCCTDGNAQVVSLALENVQTLSSTSSTAHKEEDYVDSQPSFSIPHTDATVIVREYWWGDGSLPRKSFDRIFVADCVLPKLYPIQPLVQAIDDALVESDEGLVLLSYEHRYYPDFDPRERFRELAKEHDLLVEVVEMEDYDEIYCSDDIEIWKVYRKIKQGLCY